MTDIVKAGWLQKQSTFLKRWKKKWCSLSSDGYVRQFETPDDLEAKRTLLVPQDVIAIRTGLDVDHKPPEGNEHEWLIELVTKHGDPWILCAENLDDMLAWHMALEQARVMNQPQRAPHQPNIPANLPPYLQEVIVNNPNNGYPMYYRGNNYQGRYPYRIVQTPQGPITVVYIDDGYYRYRNGSDGLGLLAGAALASTLFFPFWFPLFLWC